MPDESESFSRAPSGRISNETGFPLALYRVEFQARPGTPEEMARQFLAARASELGVRADGSDLRHRVTSSGKATTTVRFEQTYRGVPVYRAETTVSMNRASEISFVMHGYKHGVSLADVTPAVARRGRAGEGDAAPGAAGPAQFDRTDLVVYHGKGASRLAHRVPHGPEGPADRRLGSARRCEDRRAVPARGPLVLPKHEQPEGTATGTATVFTPDPLSSAGGVVYGTAGFVDGGDADTPAADGRAGRRSRCSTST